MYFYRKNKAGFTLIELMVVVSIIGFLATIISAGLNRSRDKALDARRVNDIFSIQKAIEIYFNEQESYPPGSSLVMGSANATCFSQSGFHSVCPGGERIYLGRVPGDPNESADQYEYTRSASGIDYELTFSLSTDVGNLSQGNHTLTSTGVQ